MLLYRLLLASRVSYLFARLYLMLSMALSALIPLLAIPIASARIIEITIPMNSLFVQSDAEQVAAQALRFDWGDAALVLYIAVAALALLILAVELWRIRSFRRGAEHTFSQGFDIYSSPRITASFCLARCFCRKPYLRKPCRDSFSRGKSYPPPPLGRYGSDEPSEGILMVQSVCVDCLPLPCRGTRV